MGLFNLSLFIGLSVGPLVGGLISDGFGLQGAFLGMGLLAAVGFVLTLWLLPPRADETPNRSERLPAGWLILLKDARLLGLFSMRLAYAACIGMVWGFMPVFAKTHFNLSATAIGVLVTLGVLVSGLLHPPMGKLADRVNRPALVVAGGLVTCGAIGGFWWVGGFGGLVIVNLLLGAGGGIAMPAVMALAVERGQAASAMGSVMAMITMAHSLGMLVGAVSAGAMMQWLELRHVFPLGAAAMVAALVAFLVLTPLAPRR
jgi:DHA1 family multidrug resistance protein-like MFS transporter